MIVPNEVMVADFVQEYVTFDEPIPYKDLKIYPVKLKDSFIFLSSCNILTIDKNSISDVNIIQMNYLQFIFEYMVYENIWADKFLKIISMCFNIKEDSVYLIDKFDKGVLLYKQISDDEDLYYFNGWNIKFVLKNKKISLLVNNIEFSSREFDEIKQLILYQNIFNYDDTYIDPDVKKLQDDYYKLRNKTTVTPTIEKQMSVVSSENGMSKSEMMNMTYREFTILFNTIVDKIDYQINRRADLQDKRFEQSVPHWIFEAKDAASEKIFVDADGFKKKMESVL